MSETIDALLCNMLAWLARGARPYDEVMEAWRTSCPRLPVWEDAVDHGLVARTHRTGETPLVEVTRIERGTFAFPTGAGIFKRAPHPHAALLFETELKIAQKK